MGDHGLRVGAIRSTSVGELEENNPMLILTLPQRLRNNSDLRQQLEANSRLLITHFDLYATFVEIAHVSRTNLHMQTPILSTNLGFGELDE